MIGRAVSAVEVLEDEVRDAVRLRGLDPAQDVAAIRDVAVGVAVDLDARSVRGEVAPLGDPGEAVRDVMDRVCGLGPLQRYLEDPEIEEIWINEPGRIFVARHGRSELTTTLLESDDVRELVERMLRTSGRRLDLSTPFVDASLVGGERLHVAIPDVTHDWAVNIRKFVARVSRLGDLVTLGSLTPQAASFLEAAVVAGFNVLVSGATQAGKTTMLRALLGAVPAQQRIVTVEEVFELRIRHRDVVAMQTRPPNLEGVGEIPLRRLVKETLRMRPDRIVVGEVREAEAFDMLVALNAGVPGMCTVHANSAREAVTKLCTLPLLAGENVTASFVVPTVASAVDLVVHLDLARDGTRSVREILGVTGRVEQGVVETSELFARRGGRLVRGGGFIHGAERFERAGYDAAALLTED